MIQYAVVHKGKAYWPGQPPPTAAGTVDHLRCRKCGGECVPEGITTGYGIHRNAQGEEEILCFACCAEVDKAEMRATGFILLYLTRDEGGYWYKLTNWPGSLRFAPCEVKVRTVNAGFCRVKRRDVRFRFEGALWYGRGQGDNDIIRCRRMKVRKGK